MCVVSKRISVCLGIVEHTANVYVSLSRIFPAEAAAT